MIRLVAAIALVAGLLVPAAQAFNEIFGTIPLDPTCTTCLDNAFLSCPGYYQDASYAECMCKGDGGKNFVACVGGSCSVGPNAQGNAAASWYNYCTIFYPQEMCAEGQSQMTPDLWEQRCGNVAADSDSGNDSGNSSSSGSDSASGTGSSSQPSTTSRANAVKIPPWGVVIGLGMQLMNLNL